MTISRTAVSAWFLYILLAVLSLAPAVVEASESYAEPDPRVLEQPIDFAELTRAQYAGAVSMAMETMRLVLGEMTEEETAIFEAQWMPLFRYPTREIIDYFNKLNPLLAKFLSLRTGINETYHSYHEAIFELTVALDNDDVGMMRILALRTSGLVRQIDTLNASLQAVIVEILALGSPPDADDLRRRRRQRHDEAFTLLQDLQPPSFQITPGHVTAEHGQTIVFQAVAPNASKDARVVWRPSRHTYVVSGDFMNVPVDTPVALKFQGLTDETTSLQQRTISASIFDPNAEPRVATAEATYSLRPPAGAWVLEGTALRGRSFRGSDKAVDIYPEPPEERESRARARRERRPEPGPNPERLIYPHSDAQAGKSHATLAFLNPPQSRGWRAHARWSEPPARLVPGTELKLDVSGRLDYIGERMHTGESRDALRTGTSFWVDVRLCSVGTGEPAALPSQIDLVGHIPRPAPASVQLDRTTTAASGHLEYEVPIPDLITLPDWAARQRLVVVVGGQTVYWLPDRRGMASIPFWMEYVYRWVPGATGQEDAGMEMAAGVDDPASLSDAERDALAQQMQIAFHEANIRHFRDAIRRARLEHAAEPDINKRTNLLRNILYQEDALQRELDAIATIRTGQFVRTRTEADAYNMKLMLEASQKDADEASLVTRTHERMPHLLAMIEDDHERERLTAFFRAKVETTPGGLDAQTARALVRIIGNQVQGHLERDAADAMLAAIDAQENLRYVENVKTICDWSLWGLSTLSPVLYAHHAPQVLGAAYRAKIGYARAKQAKKLYMLYQGTTGFVDGFAKDGLWGGMQQSFTLAATTYSTSSTMVNYGMKVFHAGMKGYHEGVLLHLEEYTRQAEAHARDPRRSPMPTLNEEYAGIYQGVWRVGEALLKKGVEDWVIGKLMPRDPAGASQQPPPKRWPTIEETRRQAHFQSRQANGRAKVNLFQKRAARLAEAGKAGASREEILSLRESMNEAYRAVKSDYFAKMNMRSRVGNEPKLVHYYNSCERGHIGQLKARVKARMTEQGWNEELEYKTFSNSASKGKVGMDLDFGVKEPPRFIRAPDGTIVANPEHRAWRMGLTQTQPDGKTVRRSIHEFQVAGHEALMEAYEEVYGRPPGEAMVEFTTSYHPEAYADTAWLGKKGMNTAVYADTNPAWVQQAADVTAFKVNRLPKDHPSLGHYGTMQERMRTLAKDYDTKLTGMPPQQKAAGNEAFRQKLAHMHQLRDIFHAFGEDEIGPIEAEQQMREISGGQGLEEVAVDFGIFMQSLHQGMQ